MNEHQLSIITHPDAIKFADVNNYSSLLFVIPHSLPSTIMNHCSPTTTHWFTSLESIEPSHGPQCYHSSPSLNHEFTMSHPLTTKHESSFNHHSPIESALVNDYYPLINQHEPTKSPITSPMAITVPPRGRSLDPTLWSQRLGHGQPGWFNSEVKQFTMNFL